MYTYDLIIANDWGTGFTANLVITNLSDTAMTWSQLEFEAPFQISNLWNGEIVSEDDNRYVIADAGWNQTIAPGGQITIGFNGRKTPETDIQLANFSLAGWGSPNESTPPPESPAPIEPPTISADDIALAEGNTETSQSFRISLSSTSDEPVSVKYTTANGSATAGEDYAATSGTLTFAPGETEKYVSIDILGDTQEEADEFFYLELSEATNGNLASDRVTVTLENDDVAPPPVASPPPTTDLGSHISFNISNDWGNGFVGNITVQNDSAQPLNVESVSFQAPFEIQNIWGASFTQTNGLFVFTPVEWNQQIMPGEKITFGFVGSKAPDVDPTPTNYQLNGREVVSPSNPEPTPPTLPTLTVENVTVSEDGDGSGETFARFRVTLSEDSNQTVTVGYETADESAIAPQDYESSQGTITFAPGETEKVISVAIANDDVAEASETFQIRLSNPTGATLETSQGIATILDSDPDIISPPDPDPAPDPEPEPPSPSPSTGQFNYAEPLQTSFLFYEAQRSGRLPSDNRIDWRGDSALNDGADVDLDLSGGYYDAGDHVKFGFPMAGAMTLLSWGVEEYRSAYANTGQLDEALDAIRWGTDYILKAHVTDEDGTREFWGQVGDGNTDHAYWGAPEDMTMARPAFKVDRQNPGSDLTAEAAAALAAASIIFRPTDPVYADQLLTNAEQLYEFADTYRGKYSDAIPNAQNFYNSWSGYHDELAWGAAWLYEATGNAQYLQQAESIYETYLGGLDAGWTHDWDNKSHGAAVLLAQQTGAERYQQDVENWLNSWVNGSNGVQITDGGLRWISQWGALRYAANTAFVAGIYADTVDDPNGAYSDLAETTVDYLLGDNPRNFSYVVGFGDSYPQQPHHRAAHGGTWANFNDAAPNANILYGALVGGPSEANDYAYEDSRSNYITNEVTLDYNAGFTGALARMVELYGGDPLSNAELNDLPGISVSETTSAF